MARPNGEVATCYQSHFSFEPAVAAIGLIVIGSGLHSTRIAGRRLVLLGVGRIGNLSSVMEASMLGSG